MPSAYALGMFSGKIIFNFAFAERSKRIFTSGVVKVNCICHTAFSLANAYYQYFRFYNSSVLYYNEASDFTSQKYRRLFS